MSSVPPRRTPPWAFRVGRLPGWLVLLGALAVCVAIVELSWVLFAPWAVGWLPGPKLIGSYTGELVAGQGARYTLWLVLEPKVQRASPGARRADNLTGRAQLCTPAGLAVAYRVSGKGNPTGSEITLRLEYADPKLSQLNLDFQGSWEEDRLELLPGRRQPFLPDGSFLPNRPLRSDDPDDYFRPVVLYQSSEVGNACPDGGSPLG